MIDHQSVSALDAWTAATRPHGSARGIVAPAVPNLSQEKVLVEVTREVRARLNSDLGVRFGQ